MESIEIIDTHQWHPLRMFGIDHAFFTLNASTISQTWIALIVLLIFALPFYYFLKKKNGLGHFMTTSLLASGLQFVTQALGSFSASHFFFIGSLFIFIFLCNILSVIPFVEEPTRDVNTTLALGTVSFLYIQIWAIKTHGFGTYMRDLFAPFFLMFPLNVIGKLATIISISFRLFGNIFGGSIIMQILENFLRTHVLIEMFAIVTGINLITQLFFGLFESFLQAFVFAMLSLTYLAIAVQKDDV